MNVCEAILAYRVHTILLFAPQVKSQIEVRKDLLELEKQSPHWLLLPSSTTVTKFLVAALEIEGVQ